MDFDWTPEQTALRDQARKVADEAVERYGRQQRFVDQRVLQGLRQGDGRPRLDRHDLADRVRRRWPAADQPPDRGRAADRGRRADRRDVVRRPPDGPDADQVRHRRPAGRVPPRHPVGRDHVVHRDVRTRRRVRPRLAHHLRPSRGRRVRDQRPEDLDELRGARRLLLPDLPHQRRRATASGHQRGDRADGHPRASRSARSPT